MMLLLGVVSTLTQAQTVSINGFVRDEASSEAMIGAIISFNGSEARVATNNYGFYSAKVRPGEVIVSVHYVGYQPLDLSFDIVSDTSLNIDLSATVLEGVEIVSDRIMDVNSGLGRVSISITSIKKIPSLGGEVDVLKAMTTMPGISSGQEGTSGIFVRGGSPDQNLILLDGAPVYNASHFFGYLSVFNPNAIKHIDTYKGGFLSKFGGRLSSVIDIHTKEGNKQKYEGGFGIGTFTSSAQIEGPIVKGRSSFFVSGRTSNLFLYSLPQKWSYREDDPAGMYDDLGFYDINLKLNYDLDEKSTLYASYYSGKDFFSSVINGGSNSVNEDGVKWGNNTATLRYFRTLNSNLFMNVILYHTQYKHLNYIDNSISGDFTSSYNYQNKSEIKDNGLSVNWLYNWAEKHYLEFGGQYVYHQYNPSSISLNVTEGDDMTNLVSHNAMDAHEAALFIEDSYDILPSLNVTFGLRSTFFNVNNKSYYSLEPRATVSYGLTAHLTVIGTYSEMKQYLHLLTNNTTGLPNDTWVPATDKVKPQDARQISLGIVKKNLFPNIDFAIEGYYKWMSDLIDYEEGTTITTQFNQSWEDVVVANGDGVAKGVETMIEYHGNRLSGWLSYTWSKNTRQFDEINSGDAYPFKYDRRHDFSITGSYDLNKEWSIASTWVYTTGFTTTLPVSRHEGPYDLDDGYFRSDVVVYDQRNNSRMPDYHRLDISATRTRKTKRDNEAKLSFGIYNAYLKQNPVYLQTWNSLSVDADGNRVSEMKVLGKVYFPFIPYINYSIKF
ncbi:MAG: TonB-dependent receptor [Reichenbachiella sp.]